MTKKCERARRHDTILQYCNNNILSLCWHLNLSLSTLNNPKLVLHFSFCSQFRVCTDLRPLLSSLVLVHQKNIFISISRLDSSWYLSVFSSQNYGCLCSISTRQLELYYYSGEHSPTVQHIHKITQSSFIQWNNVNKLKNKVLPPYINSLATR